MKSLSDKALLLVIANLIKYAVGFVMPMVLVRVLGQNEYGTYQQLILIGTAAFGVMTLGLPMSVYYFFHNAGNRGGALIVQTTLMLAVAGLITATVMILVALPIAQILNNPALSSVLQVYAISVGFMIASEHHSHFMIAQDRYKLAVWFETGEIVIRVLCLLSPLFLGLGLAGLVSGIVIYAILKFAVRTVYLFASSSVDFSGWTKSIFPLKQLRFGTPIALGNLAGLIGGTFNKGIVASAFTPKDYAVYSVGTLEIPLDSIFQASVANVLRASLPPLVRDGNLTAVVDIVRESIRKLSIIVLPSFIFLFAYAYEFITLLFTKQYAEAVPIFQIYVWQMPLHMLILSVIPQVFGKPKIGLYLTLFSTGLLLVLSYVLLKGIGFYGPAIAFVAVQYVTCTLNVAVVLRLTRTTLWKLLPFPHMLRAVAASLCGILLSRLTNDLTHSALLGFLMAGAAFSFGFLTVAAAIGVFTDKDYQLLKRWLDARRRDRGS